jgi:hypothetical protein
MKIWERNVNNHSVNVTQTGKPTHVWIRNLDTEKEARLEVLQMKFLKPLVGASTETIYLHDAVIRKQLVETSIG